jgi:5-methylcytosine-specific restriction endonuclease McrA
MVEPYVAGLAVGAVCGVATALLVAVVWRRPRAVAAPRRQAIPERVRHEVWRRDRGRCVECGSRGRLEFDHIIPVSRGGANTVRNIALRCEPCNRRKGARI